MNSSKLLKEQLTILVNTCDAYEDLWVPFFTLLKKYWDPDGIRILLNTESKDFSFNGLKIECVHSPGEKRYGQRMLNALKQVKTEYVLSLLDDFFIRSQVDEGKIERVVRWMEEDPDIVCFNCDPNRVYVDWEVDKYPGFKRIPPGCSYLLSMQAAVWRTEKLAGYWLPELSPWEWEECTNAITTKCPEKKFYCLTDIKHTFLDYGYKNTGMGVFCRKWVIEDVGPLFEKENISVDFSKRGIYDRTQKRNVITFPTDWKGKYDRVVRCLGKREIPHYLWYCVYRWGLGLFNFTVEPDYFDYLRFKAQERFLKKYNKL